MSLVAAYSDSESDSEDGANEIHTDKKYESNKIGEVATYVKSSSSLATIADEEIENENDIEYKEESVNAGESLFSLLPQPKPKKYELVEESDDEFMKKTNNISEMMSIPPSSVETCNEEENPVKRASLNLPNPSRKIDKKQRVKITIPTLEEIGDDSDSDDDNSKINVNNQIKKKSTLVSLLPRPRHSVTVGTNKNNVFSLEANRPLIPYTLTKKKDQSVKTESSKEKKKERKPLVADFSGSDDDDNIVPSDNFFSLGTSKTKTHDIPGTNSSLPSEVERNEIQHDRTLDVKEDSISPRDMFDSGKHVSSLNKNPPIDNHAEKGNSFFSNLYKSDLNKKTESVTKTNINTNLINTESNTFIASTPYSSASVTDSTEKHIFTDTTHSDVTAPYSDVTAPYSDVTAPYSDATAPYSDVTAPYGSATAPYGSVPTYVNVSGSYGSVSSIRHTPSITAHESSTQQSSGNEKKTYPTSQNFFTYAYNENEVSQQPDTVEDLPIDEDALKALQGNKRMKEDINVIDIRADDIQANNTDFLKNLTSESAETQKLRSRKDKDQPTSGQKRKHQITYLAFQAKERELELQQAWSESLASKRQTQSKYGF